MGEKRRSDDDHLNVRNDLSGEVHGPVGQFGSVHGDVHLNWSGPARSPQEEAFRQRYIARKQAEWDAEEERRRLERNAEEQARRREQRKERAQGFLGSLVAALIAYGLLQVDGWGFIKVAGVAVGIFALLALLGSVLGG
ncbi:hypothetical protein ACFVIM_02625 [Streptomyces sp. NPDC057638]|uniref:hypothetical protein n=1 Tax=Streptomyces sp. NPDC057638 TaxID=3346190 RepID=UPI0036C1685A